MSYLVLHATHGPGTWNLLYEGTYSEVQDFLLEKRYCPPDHYRIFIVEVECGVSIENHNERFFVRASK